MDEYKEIEYKEIYKNDDGCICKTISMNQFGVFEIKSDFAKEYGGGVLLNYVGRTEVKAMMKAVEEMENEEKAN